MLFELSCGMLLVVLDSLLLDSSAKAILILSPVFVSHQIAKQGNMERLPDFGYGLGQNYPILEQTIKQVRSHFICVPVLPRKLVTKPKSVHSW